MKASYPEQQPNVENLIVENMNLVKKIAWHMHGRVRSAIEIEDLMQIGYFGLVTAAQKYSPKEGATFASYAVLRIRGAIVDHLRKSSNLCRTTIQMQQKQKKAQLITNRPLVFRTNTQAQSASQRSVLMAAGFCFCSLPRGAATQPRAKSPSRFLIIISE